MANYKITKLQNHEVTLQYGDNITRNFILPLDENNNYPSGQNLTDLLEACVKYDLERQAIANTRALNENEVLALVETPTETAETVRLKRRPLLRQSDWTQGPDAPLTAEQKTAWATYRQALRDITAQSGFPLNVIWPTEPST
jgi:hypothetical protein